MGRIDISYVEKDGILYPLLTIPADMELSAVGKYGLLWLTYMKENHKGRFRTLTRLGCVNRTVHKVNEETYEMLDVMISQHGTHDEFIKVDGIYKRFINAREIAGSWNLGA